MVPNGRLCQCGHSGCLETVVSGPRIIETVASALKAGVQCSLREKFGDKPEAITIQDIIQAAPKALDHMIKLESQGTALS